LKRGTRGGLNCGYETKSYLVAVAVAFVRFGLGRATSEINERE
jgi:hypothetical protein